MSSAYSVKIPLNDNLVTDQAYNRTILEVLRQNIKMILLTEPGERIMEPDFGVGMKKFLFEPLNTLTQSKIEERIKEQFKSYLAGLVIENIFIEPLQDNNRYNLKIAFSYAPARIEREYLEISI